VSITLADRERHNPYVRAQPRSWDATGAPSSDTTGSYELVCPACGDDGGPVRAAAVRAAGASRAVPKRQSGQTSHARIIDSLAQARAWVAVGRRPGDQRSPGPERLRWAYAPRSRTSFSCRWSRGSCFASRRASSGTSSLPIPRPWKSVAIVTRDRLPASSGSTMPSATATTAIALTPRLAQVLGGCSLVICSVIRAVRGPTRRVTRTVEPTASGPSPCRRADTTLSIHLGWCDGSAT
jgi:hypothetical protein